MLLYWGAFQAFWGEEWAGSAVTRVTDRGVLGDYAEWRLALSCSLWLGTNLTVLIQTWLLPLGWLSQLQAHFTSYCENLFQISNAPAYCVDEVGCLTH